MSQDKLNKIYRILRKARNSKRISQKYCGKFIGCNQSQYSKKERMLQHFTMDELFEIADLLDVDVNIDIKYND